jgi:thioredoxin-like negative regulator of GroEL
MNYKDLFQKQNVNWKYIALIVFIIIVVVCIICWFRSGTNNSEQVTHIRNINNGQEHKQIVTEGMDSSINSNNNANKESYPKDEIILYYATWCGYSRMFLPEWEKFVAYAKDNLPSVKVSSIRCEDGNEAVCTQKGVEGYPTIILYLKNGEQIQFAGERNTKQLSDFIRKNT